jgi:integrase
MFLQTTSHGEEIRQYLRDLTHVPRISLLEMHQLLEQIANAPSTAHHARMRLAEAHLDFVLQLVQHYQPFGVPLSDLIGEGNLILTEAAHVFDPHGPLSFPAFVRVQVCQHLANVIKQHVRESYPEPFASEILCRVIGVSLALSDSDTKVIEADWNDLPNTAEISALSTTDQAEPNQEVYHEAPAQRLQPSQYDEQRWQKVQSQPSAIIIRANQLAPADLDNWQPVLRFLQATGLRRSELKSLKVCDILALDPEMGGLAIQVQRKGSRTRIVPVLPGREQDVLTLITSRVNAELVFPCIPQHLNVPRFRREYAQALYLSLAPTFRLPPAEGRLSRHSYQRNAVRKVAHALGHHRIEVVLTHYLRLKHDEMHNERKAVPLC